MQKRKFRILSAATVGSLALAAVAITASSSTSPAAKPAALAVQIGSFPPVNLDACPILHTGYPQGDCVAQLQTDLRIVQDPNLDVDGLFGLVHSQTYNAVIAFQTAHGLNPDGVVGPATKQALEAAIPGDSVPTPTVAGAPARAADTCGRWWPDGGKTIQSYNPGTATYTATTYFTFSQANINAFHCEGQKYMEVDQLVEQGFPPQGGNKTGSTNLPGYTYIDTDFLDTTRTLTYGTDAAQSLVANYQYYITVNLKNIGSDTRYTQIALTFQRSHKVGPSTNKKESAFWAVCRAHGGSDPVWCVAPSPGGSQPMQSELGPPMYVELHAGYTSTNSTTWGGYRQRQFTPTATMVPGDKIFSPNNLNYLIMQSDGNLVEYITGGRAVWASNTAGNPGAVFVAQGDGNYVIVAPGNRPIWATGTKSGGTTLKIQDDRNLVVYAPGNRAIWSNNIAGQP